MELLLFWASVDFTAQNGDPEGLLTAAATSGLHLSHILPCPGGFSASCAAWRYRRLAKLARKHRVRLRIQRRRGLFFRLRPLLRRRGLFWGLLLFVPLLFWLQGFVWAMDGSGLTVGQRARAAVLLWDADLFPGAFVTEAKLAAGEYALLHSGEFSWASLNFSDGRLVVEAAAAKPVPEIASGTLHGIRARTAGTILETNLVSGTMLVAPGQIVEAGQGLIGTARTERDGTLIFQPAAGRVLAQFEWEDLQDEPLSISVPQQTGKTACSFRLHFAGRAISLPEISFLRGPAFSNAITSTRHLQPELFGLRFPLSLEETTTYAQATETLFRTEDEALALARFHSRQALYAAYPDASILARKEDFSVEGESFHYRVRYTVAAEIGQENKKAAES